MNATASIHDSFEHRLRALAARGFSINLTIRKMNYGKRTGEVEFNVRLEKGESYVGTGMSANGCGYSLDEAAGAALRGAEAFLRDAEPPGAVEGALGDMARALPAKAVGEAA